MSYTRETGEQRRLIHNWRHEGKSVREMAGLLKGAASTVSREVRRNTGGEGGLAVPARSRRSLTVPPCA
jgi:IS30 family transposase